MDVEHCGASDGNGNGIGLLNVRRVLLEGSMKCGGVKPSIEMQVSQSVKSRRCGLVQSGANLIRNKRCKRVL